MGEAVLRIVADDLAAGLIRHDAAAPGRLRYRRKTGRHRCGAHARQATSALELACWDLLSRATGLSVTGLLGGTVRDTVPAYASALGLDPAHAAAPEAAAATDTGELVSVVDAWSAIGQVVPREQLAEALATIAAVVPDADGDDDAEWRAELVARYGTVRGFIRLLAEVIDFGVVEAGGPVVKTLKALPDLIGRKGSVPRRSPPTW